jgi:hypothetical protein
MRFEKRYSAGISLLASYTWSKTITDGVDGIGVGWGAFYSRDNYCRSCERGLSSYDQPHRFVMNATYELPLGRGKAAGANWNKLVDAVLEQWQVNGILTLSPGLPLMFGLPQNTSYSFGGGQNPDSTGINADLGDEKTLERWFDTRQFLAPQPYTFGNLGRTHPNLRQDFATNLDFSLFKSVRVKDRARVQLRGEAFNLANHSVFSSPGTTLNTATFGVVTGTSNRPRQIQLGVKVLF